MMIEQTDYKVDPSSTTGLRYWETFMRQADKEILDLLLPVTDRSARKEIFRRNVATINVETSSRCNRTCTYCPDAEYDRTTQILLADGPWQRILSNICDIQYEREVSLNLYNEPMLDPTLMIKISQLKRASSKVVTKISSNGDLLNSRTLAELENAGLNRAYVTLHQPAGTAYEDAKQLDSFRKFFKRCKITSPPKLEHQPGVRIVCRFNFGATEIVLMSNNWGVIGNDRAGTVVHLRRSAIREAPCMRVFREFTISHLGEVFPCCQFFPDAPSSKAHIVGNVATDDIWDIYTNEQSVAWRRGMFDFSPKLSPCDSCRDLDNAAPETGGRRTRLVNESAN